MLTWVFLCTVKMWSRSAEESSSLISPKIGRAPAIPDGATLPNSRVAALKLNTVSVMGTTHDTYLPQNDQY